MSKKSKWLSALGTFSTEDINIKHEWEFILEYFNIKKFSSITRSVLLEEDVKLCMHINDIFNWTYEKRLDDILGILIIDKYYPWELDLLSDIDNQIKSNKSILIIPLFYYNIIEKKYNRHFFHSFLIDIINHITTYKIEKNMKPVLALLLRSDDLDYITNMKKLKNYEDIIILSGHSLKDNNETNKQVIEVLNLFISNKIIDLFNNK